MRYLNNKIKEDTVMNIELTALLKYLWAVLIPVFMKGWNIVDNKFKTADNRVSSIEDKQSEMNADLKVLVERSENQEKVIDAQTEKINKIYDMLVERSRDN